MLHQLRKQAEGAFHALLPCIARKACRDGTAPNIFVSRTLGPNRSYGRVFEGGVWMIIRQGNRPIHAHCCGIGRGLRCGAARVEVVQRSFPRSRERCPKIEQSPIRRRASKPQSQNDSGLPQGRVGASRLRQRKAGAAFYNGGRRLLTTEVLPVERILSSEAMY